jgi:Ser-tRNA(Ala) deacylase AlaX
MTDRLYQQDSYLTTFQARVVAVDAEGVMLDRTAFFPSGGGVLGDEGALKGPHGQIYRVIETVEDHHGCVTGSTAPGWPRATPCTASWTGLAGTC